MNDQHMRSSLVVVVTAVLVVSWGHLARAGNEWEPDTPSTVQGEEVYLWSTTGNWSDGVVPNEDHNDRVGIVGTGAQRAVIQSDLEAYHFSNQIHVGVNRTGQFSRHQGDGQIDILSGGKLTSKSTVIVGHKMDGPAIGTINLRGGAHVDKRNGRSIKLGYGGGTGIYNVYSGYVTAGDPVYIGWAGDGARGEFNVSGGTIDTGTVYLDYGNNDTETSGLFTVSGGGASSISTTGWVQKEKGTLKAVVGTNGVTPIEVTARNKASSGSGNVEFHEGATLDVRFKEDSARPASWEVMTWEGERTDDGLRFADSVDKKTWGFNVVDTEGDGSPDTLRVSAVPDRDQRIASVKELSGEVPDRAVRSLIAVLEAQKLEDRLAAIETIKRMGNEAAPALSASEAKPAVEVMLNHRGLQEEAIEAGLAAGVFDLEQLALEHENPDVRRTATGMMTDQDVLRRIATNREEILRVRTMAIRQITDQDVLRGIATDEDEKRALREAAGQQLPDNYWRFPNKTKKAYPLPEGSNVLDRVVFGSQPSEEAHNFAAGTSRLVEGTKDRIGRQITRNAPKSDVPPGETIGSCSFTMDCGSDEQVYLTVKAQQTIPHPKGAIGFTVFHGNDQIGYTLPKHGASMSPVIGKHRVVKGDWVYFTLALPRSLTDGREHVEFHLATYHHSRTRGGPIVQRAYTHKDELFALPRDEEETLGRDFGEPWGEGNDGDIDTAIATMTENVEAAVETAQQRDHLSARVTSYLARATTRNWIGTVDTDAIYEAVRKSIDRAVIRQYKAGGPSERPFGRAWIDHGYYAAGFVKLSEMFRDRGELAEPIPDHPEDVTRREAYADFWASAWKWRDDNRRWITNQILIVTDGLVSIADALEILAPDRAPSREKVDAWIDQAIGITPLKRLPGEEDAGGLWSSGVYHTFSEAGLNREVRYSAGYSNLPNLHLPKMIEDTGLERIKERLADVIEGMGWFRWRGVALDDDRRRVSMQAAYLGNRGNMWPGTGSYQTWPGYGRAPAALDVLGPDAEVARRWAELMIEHGADFESYEGQPERLYHMMHIVDGLRTLKDMEPSTYKLPWERERAVFGDPDQAMVSITDGDVRLHVSLGHNVGTHASDVVQFDYQGPNSDRAGTTTLHRHEFPMDKMIERPNGVVFWNPDRDRWSIANPYLPWKGERGSVNQYLAREDVPHSKLPIAGRPGGGSWPEGSFHRGFTYSYREAQVGPYRIGINPTGGEEVKRRVIDPDTGEATAWETQSVGEHHGFGPGQTYEMEVPDGNVINLKTGQPVRADTVTVGPRKTVVLKVED